MINRKGIIRLYQIQLFGRQSTLRGIKFRLDWFLISNLRRESHYFQVSLINGILFPYPYQKFKEKKDLVRDCVILSVTPWVALLIVSGEWLPTYIDCPGNCSFTCIESLICFPLRPNNLIVPNLMWANSVWRQFLSEGGCIKCYNFEARSQRNGEKWINIGMECCLTTACGNVLYHYTRWSRVSNQPSACVI